MGEQENNTFESAPGIVYLVGAGPGDPGLITVKGLEKIRTADCIVYDYLAGERFLEEARDDAELIYVGKKGADHTLEQAEINEILVRKAEEGKRIVRLKGGDPFVFGRGGEEAEDLLAAGIRFEVVPGVTSAVAAPAYAGIPVTHRDHASMVTFITGHENPSKKESAIDWGLLARNPGTLVFLMGVKNLGRISESLISAGKPPDTPAAIVRWGTTPAQRSLKSTLATIPEEAKQQRIKPPAVLVVGSVADLRDKLSWFETKALFGKRILITRTREQSRGLADKVLELGGEPVLFPTICIQPPSNWEPVDEAIGNVASYDWIIFTSVNGVERFFDRFFEVRTDIRDLAGPRIGAIGPVTAASVRQRGLKVDLLAKEFKAEGVLAQLSEDNVRGRRFLIPRAEKAREILPDGIIRMGGHADVVSVYRTTRPAALEVEKIRDMLENKRVDAVTFTSSSTVTHFIDILTPDDVGRLLDGVVVASIGPITSRTIMENGLSMQVEASEYTIDGLLQAITRYYSIPQTR